MNDFNDLGRQLAYGIANAGNPDSRPGAGMFFIALMCMIGAFIVIINPQDSTIVGWFTAVIVLIISVLILIGITGQL